MKNIKFKWLIARKSKGEGSFIAALLVITTLLMITAFCMGVNKDFNRKAKLDDCVRSYSLIAETQGGLTDNQRASMINAVSNIMGVSDTYVSVNCPQSGTKIYGQNIELEVSVSNYSSYNGKTLKTILKFFGFSENANSNSLSVRKQSTSKY